MAIISKKLVPDVALIDPVVTTTMNSNMTVYTGFDILSHSIEAYVSNASSPILMFIPLKQLNFSLPIYYSA
jgi:alcohol dehydrogenase